MTSDTGYVNVLSDWQTLDFDIEAPICNVYAQSLTWKGFKEQSDYNGPMLATYSGVVTAEKACENVLVLLTLKEGSSKVSISNVTITPTKEGIYTYTFTQDIQGPNDQGWYKASIKAYDASNPSDHSFAYAA